MNITREFSSNGIFLLLEFTQDGNLSRILLELATQSGAVMTTWTLDGGVVAFNEGKILPDTRGGSHPQARVAPLTPMRVPDRIIEAALSQLALEESLRASIRHRLLA